VREGVAPSFQERRSATRGVKNQRFDLLHPFASRGSVGSIFPNSFFRKPPSRIFFLKPRRKLLMPDLEPRDTIVARARGGNGGVTPAASQSWSSIEREALINWSVWLPTSGMSFTASPTSFQQSEETAND
jgi:hypothetical protein